MSLLRKLLKADWGAITRGFYDYNIAHRYHSLPPRQVVVDVTYRCNARCLMCNIWRTGGRDELSREALVAAMDGRVCAHLERLMISGGEPFLRSDLVALIDDLMVRMPHLQVLSVITNGLSPDRILAGAEEIVQRCKQRGVQLSFSVSLDGVGDVHDRIRNVPGAFDRTQETALRLKELGDQHGFFVGVGCVICRLNLGELGKLRAWGDEHNIPIGFQIIGFHETYVDNLSQQANLDFREEDRPALYALLQELASERALGNFMAYYWRDMLHMYRDGTPRQTPCPFAIESFVLDAQGNVRYCETTKNIGNCVRDGTCSDIYYRPENLTYRRSMWTHSCPVCNSGCLVNVGLRKQVTRHLAYALFGF
ncbi:MAG: radical SAM protein [Chloroflexi bacterium]|nr:radical SAM protein [Chloroflexota bacterium]